MKPIDYIIIAAIALIVIAVVVYIVRKKLKGEKVGCGCGCQSCPHAGACGGQSAEEKQTDEACVCSKTQKKDNENE